MSRFESPKPREAFPVVMNSPAMRQLLGAAVRQGKDKRLICLAVKQGDRLELGRFFVRLAYAVTRSNRIHMHHLGTIDPTLFEDGEETSFLFLQGDRMRVDMQRALNAHQLHLPLTVLAMDPANATELNHVLIPDLLKKRGPILTWPSWKERPEDQASLCEIIRTSYQLPGKQPAPKLSPEALNLLLATDFEDLRSVQDTIKSGVQAYIATHLEGPLTAELLSTRRSLKRNSRPRNSSPKVAID